MSNESERIDLTRFEGMYDIEGIGPHPKNLFEEVERKFKDGGVQTKPLYLNNQEVNAITLLPDLIAEVKRCYEKIDWLQKTADLASNYIGEIHHSHWDIFEERMIEAGLWERPSE